jgi:riboflavin-specific deaminase-like protein
MRYDAILVGADTVRADDPALDVRLPGVVARPAARVVLAASGRLPTASRVFRDDGAIVLVYVAEGAKAAAAARLPATATVVEVPATATDTIDVDAVLRDLGGRGMLSVLIEGGARTAGLFLRAGRIDALALFRAPALLGDRGGRPVIDDDAVEAPELASRLRVEGRLALGEDDVVFGRLMAAKEARCSRG